MQSFKPCYQVQSVFVKIVESAKLLVYLCCTCYILATTGEPSCGINLTLLHRYHLCLKC